MRTEPLRVTRRHLIASGLGVVIPGCAGRPPRNSNHPVRDVPTSGDRDAGLVAAHNLARARRGLPPLCPSVALTTAAGAHAQEMALRRRMTHRGADGSTHLDRIRSAGYPAGASGENVAAGQTSVDQVVRDWMASPGHRRNILGNYAEIGTGCAIDASGTAYWCVTFGTTGLALRPAGRPGVV